MEKKKVVVFVSKYFFLLFSENFRKGDDLIEFIGLN